MANTYGFLRTASNNVGNTVEGVLGVEGSLTDMKKDLDSEYQRWKEKKTVLLSEREKLTSEASRLKNVIQKHKMMKEELDRTLGDVAQKKTENQKSYVTNQENESKRATDRKGMEEDIDALKCATKTIQQAKQERLDAMNRKTTAIKDQNRLLQEQVFQLNKATNTLITDATKQNVTNKDHVSSLLFRVEALQKQIHGLETELLAQAQLEEAVERARERLSKQSSELIKQQEKITEAQKQCLQNKHFMSDEIEAMKRQLNAANIEMMQCQNLDGTNQHLQTELNTCILRKRVGEAR